MFSSFDLVNRRVDRKNAGARADMVDFSIGDPLIVRIRQIISLGVTVAENC